MSAADAFYLIVKLILFSSEEQPADKAVLGYFIQPFFISWFIPQQRIIFIRLLS